MLRRFLMGIVAAVVATAFWYLPLEIAGADASSDTSAFIAKINELRQSKGRAPLRLDTQLTGVARNWSNTMANRGDIWHNPNLASQVTSNWEKLGENVGMGSNVDSIFRAFVNSPGHFANLVDPKYTHMGVSVVWKNGRLYTTHDFMKLIGFTATTTTTTMRKTTTTTKAAPAADSRTSTPSSTSTSAPRPSVPPTSQVSRSRITTPSSDLPIEVHKETLPRAKTTNKNVKQTSRSPERTFHSMQSLQELLEF